MVTILLILSIIATGVSVILLERAGNALLGLSILCIRLSFLLFIVFLAIQIALIVNWLLALIFATTFPIVWLSVVILVIIVMAISFARASYVSSPFPSNSPEKVEKLRLDTAVPDEVEVYKGFDLAVAVRRKKSLILSEEDLPKMKSGSVQVLWPDSQYCIHLRIDVTAPDCKIHGKSSQFFRLYFGCDSPAFYFHLVPQRQGKLSIIVTVYQEDEWLGSTRTHTVAYQQPVGSVQLEVISDNMKSIVYPSHKQQMINLTRRLQKLKEMKALKGIDIEPHHLIEIEDIEIELRKMKELSRHYYD